MKSKLTSKQSRCSGASPAESGKAAIVRLSCKSSSILPPAICQRNTSSFRAGKRWNTAVPHRIPATGNPLTSCIHRYPSCSASARPSIFPRSSHMDNLIRQIVRRDASIQHSHNDVNVVMLERSQDIRQFSMQVPATRAFQPPDAEPDFSAATQTVMTRAGVPVYQFSSAVRTNRCLPARE